MTTNEIVTSFNSNVERVVPLPESEAAGVNLIRPWDTVVINKCIEVAVKWTRVNYPVTDSFERFWPLVEQELQSDRMDRLYADVRALMPELPACIEPGDSPGAPSRLEAFYDRVGDEDFRSVAFADPYDAEAYESSDGGTVRSQVWFNDQDGQIDIIELDHLDPERIAAAFRFMWAKHKAFYRNKPGV